MLQPRSIGLLCLLLALPGCRRAPSEEATGASEPVTGVETVLVQVGPFSETVSAIGQVQARAGHLAALSAPAATRVTNVLVSVGSTVRRGQSLVELETTSLRAAASSADAAVTAARLAYERVDRLVTQGISARRDLEQAASELAKARGDSIQAHRTLELATLVAPMNGVVTQLSAQIGMMVDGTAPLVSIADPSSLDVVLNVSPEVARAIHAGDRALIFRGDRITGDTVARGAVGDVAGVVDSSTRSVTIRIPISPGSDLRPGETVLGVIVAATRRKVITVPVSALVPEGDGFKVFVVDASGLALSREVTVGARTDAVAEILEGLKAGERVVTIGAYGLQDSVHVTTKAAKPDSAP